MLKHITISALGAFLLSAAPASTVAAQPLEGDSDGPGEADEAAEGSDLDSLVRVIQRRPILKAMRLELSMGGGVSTADPMHDQYLATGTARFHISEFVSIGLTYGQYFSSRSKLFNDVTRDLELFPEISQLRWYAGADISLVMFDGKFKLFDDIIGYWDIHALLGGGATVTSRSASPKPTGMIGIGFRMFLTRWLTLTFELRDHIYVESFNAGSRIVNNIVGQAGITLFLPFGFDYSYAK